jgi:ArsR family transcriptional regulator
MQNGWLEGLPMPAAKASSPSCATQLKALADEDRLKIIQVLQAGPLSVSDIAAFLDAELANVSHHLRVLHKHRLVKTRREGKHIFYALAPDFVRLSRGKRSLNLGCCKLEMPDASRSG